MDRDEIIKEGLIKGVTLIGIIFAIITSIGIFIVMPYMSITNMAPDSGIHAPGYVVLVMDICFILGFGHTIYVNKKRR